jgi:murein DD-endopeptidase MepM/ murein hydrolase activator NlpD
MGLRPEDDPRTTCLPPLLASAALLAILAVALAGASGRLRTLPAPAEPVAAAPAPAPEPPPVRFTAVTARLARDQTVAAAMAGLGLPPAEGKAVVDALTGLVDFRRARPGDQLTVERREGEAALHRLAFRQGFADEWIVERGAGGAHRGRKRPVELATELARVEVEVTSSLYESLQAAGHDPGLAVLAADVLAWDVDFYQDVRNGDALRVVVERVTADGRFLRWGEVLAAEYEGAFTGRKRLFRYADPAGQTSYFDEDGVGARRGFLRSPLRYAHLTSRFGNRRHPVLGYTRAHEGIDYGAPVGTPVWAVGDGSVRLAGWNGGCGRTVILRHRNGYETVYCHLSRIAVSPGKPVAQKDVVGFVGATGLATGPHLHYAVRHGGRHVNPLQLKVPREKPVPPEWMEDFREKIAPLRALLEGLVAVN